LLEDKILQCKAETNRVETPVTLQEESGRRPNDLIVIEVAKATVVKLISATQTQVVLLASRLYDDDRFTFS
jgi:hypothetical protein